MEWFAYKVRFDDDFRIDLSENGNFPDFNFNSFFDAF
jgi:hypothetical protein